MIDFKQENDGFVLIIGYDFITKNPKRVIPVTKEEAAEIANTFNEDFAVAVGENQKQWSLNSFKLTEAPDHPYGWTDRRKRTLFHYHEQSWHMIPSEIALIGRLAQRLLSSHA